MAILQIKNPNHAAEMQAQGYWNPTNYAPASGGSSSTYSGGSSGGGFYGGPFASTNKSPDKYNKYAESYRNKLNNQQKELGAAQSAMLPRIQAGPGNAFSAQDLSGLHTMGLQQLQSADQQRNIGIANASAARGAGGPDIGALTASGNADANRGALAQGDLNAKVQGLNLGLGQYSAFNSAFGNVGQQQASARDAYGNFLQTMRPGQYQDPVAAQQAQFNQQSALQQGQQHFAQQNQGGSFGGGGQNTLTANPNSYAAGNSALHQGLDDMSFGGQLTPNQQYALAMENAKKKNQTR